MAGPPIGFENVQPQLKIFSHLFFSFTCPSISQVLIESRAAGSPSLSAVVSLSTLSSRSH